MAEVKLKLVSQEGDIFEVEDKVACKSNLVKNNFEDLVTEEDIPLPNVKSVILQKVIEYCEHHRDDDPPEIEKPLKSAFLQEVVNPWDC